VNTATNPAPNPSMRLLIVEDDRESADYLVKAFREVGHVADLATDGEEGLALADSGEYDVLVVDRMLPASRSPTAANTTCWWWTACCPSATGCR